MSTIMNYDKEESSLKDPGLWSTMNYSVNAKDAHASRLVKGDLPIEICNRRDNRHIIVPGFWFL